MTKQEKIVYIINTLESIYPETPIPLDHKDPYIIILRLVRL